MYNTMEMPTVLTLFNDTVYIKEAQDVTDITRISQTKHLRTSQSVWSRQDGMLLRPKASRPKQTQARACVTRVMFKCVACSEAFNQNNSVTARSRRHHHRTGVKPQVHLRCVLPMVLADDGGVLMTSRTYTISQGRSPVRIGKRLKASDPQRLWTSGTSGSARSVDAASQTFDRDSLRPPLSLPSLFKKNTPVSFNDRSYRCKRECICFSSERDACKF